MRDSALNWLRGRQLGVDVKLGHTQAKAGMRPADGYFNSLLEDDFMEGRRFLPKCASVFIVLPPSSTPKLVTSRCLTG
jgi:hypothetical protein